MKPQVRYRTKLKKGDRVVVRSGSDKGQQGTITAVLPKTNQALVDGLNLAVKHRKPTQKNPSGSIDKISRPIWLSKLALIDPVDGKASRVGWQVDPKTGAKQRLARRSKKPV